LSSPNRSLSNPRISPGGDRIAFDATAPGGSPAVMVAPLDGETPIPESAWTVVEEGASHPFWSGDGRLLYFLPAVPNNDFRSGARARRIGEGSGQPEGAAFDAIAFNGMFMPTMVGPGSAPVIVSDQVVGVLADLRGDIWVMSL
jgi:Tol biopolymer transport system component